MLAEALNELKVINMVHGDLKTDNILLNEVYEPVICDLGSMVSLNKNSKENIFNQGSNNPEKLSHQPRTL